MNDVKRKLASVQEIIDVQPIDGADRIEVITVLGWKVVSRKGEFQVGDKCIYFEVDSLIPDYILKRVNLWDEEKKCGKLGTKKGNVLKTRRLRKTLSQGLCLPLEIFQN